MDKQALTAEEFSNKLSQELAKAGEAAPKDILNLDMEGASEDPIGWMMRNIMRIELGRLTYLRSIYSKFQEISDKRGTADLIIASSRTFAASMMRKYVLDAAGQPEDLEKFAFIIGVDPDVLKKNLLEMPNAQEVQNHGKPRSAIIHP